MNKLLIILILLFASCKEEGENRVLRQYLGKGRSSDTTYKKHEPYFPDLSVMARSAPMLPISHTPYYSIEEKKLDTVIMMLKKQDKMLKKLLRYYEINPIQFNGGTFGYYPDSSLIFTHISDSDEIKINHPMIPNK